MDLKSHHRGVDRWWLTIIFLLMIGSSASGQGGCQAVFANPSDLILRRYLAKFEPKPAVHQCGGTCFLEGTASHLETQISQKLGYAVQISRADLLLKLFLNRFTNDFPNGLTGLSPQTYRANDLGLMPLVDGGLETDIFSLVRRTSIKLVKAKTLKQIYLENQLLRRARKAFAEAAVSVKQELQVEHGLLWQPIWEMVRITQQRLEALQQTDLKAHRDTYSPVWHGIQRVRQAKNSLKLGVALGQLQWGLQDLLANTRNQYVGQYSERILDLQSSVDEILEQIVSTSSTYESLVYAKIKAQASRWNWLRDQEQALGLHELGEFRLNPAEASTQPILQGQPGFQTKDPDPQVRWLKTFILPKHTAEFFAFLRENRDNPSSVLTMRLSLQDLGYSFDHTQQGYFRLSERSPKLDTENSELHSLELVDVAWNDSNQPEFLVLRNSWGRGFGHLGYLFLHISALSRVAEVIFLPVNNFALIPQSPTDR